ncbi:MAG: hypothetical protein KDC34_03335 [Saprospiraceae bacterium]|nr:hypothetical protein [Saprospiraceae bacterium]
MVFFANQEDYVNSVFDKIIGQVGSQTLNQLSQAGATSGTQNRLGDSGQITADTFNKGPKHNWFLNKLLEAIEQGGTANCLTGYRLRCLQICFLFYRYQLRPSATLGLVSPPFPGFWSA